MAFRRKTNRFRTSRPGRSLAGALARKANKRHTWVECFNVVCQPQVISCAPAGELECCQAKWQIVLVDNALIQGTAGTGGFSDEATVVALRGYLSLFPTVLIDPDPLLSFAAYSTTGVVATMGLRKTDVTNQLPLGEQFDLLDSGDYTESKQRRTWDHISWPKGADMSIRGSIAGGLIGNCSNVQGSLKQCVADIDACLIPNALSNGTGYTWDVNGQHTDGVKLDIHTECEGVTYPSDSQAIDYRVGVIPPAPWTWRLNGKQRYKLREDEQLALSVSASFFSIQGAAGAAGNFAWMGRCKALIEF